MERIRTSKEMGAMVLWCLYRVAVNRRILAFSLTYTQLELIARNY